MNRQTLLRVIVLAVAAIVAVLLIVGIVMALTRTGLFMADDTNDGQTREGSSQTDTGSSGESSLPADSNSSSSQGSGSAAAPAPAATTGSIPSTGPSDTLTIIAVSLALFGGTYAAALRLHRR